MRGKTNRSRIFSNPNLLDNWYFINPINQKKLTSVNTPNSDFLIDRWRIYSYQNGTASIVDNGIQLNGEFDFGELIESSRIPNRNHLPITLSVMLSDGTVLSKTILLQNTGSQEAFNYQFNNGFRISYVRNWNDNEVDLFFYNAVGGNFTVISAKLELGTVSTLALDPPPNYAEELLKCQREFVRLTNKNIGYQPFATGVGNGVNQAVFNIHTPVPMRITPTISFSNLRIVGKGCDYVPVKSIQATDVVGSSVTALVTVDTPAYIQNAEVYQISGNDVGSIELSADL